jgi:Raf kinase inhibitor-like YbhB/YbcL family protein
VIACKHRTVDDRKARASGIRWIARAAPAAALGVIVAVATMPVPVRAAEPFTLSSPAFTDGAPLALKNAGNGGLNANCLGKNVSPPLQWTNIPKGTKSYALLMVDVDGHFGVGAVHWVAYGIPASVTGFAEGEVSKPSPKFVPGKGGQGQAIYTGPCPPAWSGVHHFLFTLMATDLDPKALPPGLTRDQLLAKIKGHVKSEAGLIGVFKHP